METTGSTIHIFFLAALLVIWTFLATSQASSSLTSCFGELSFTNDLAFGVVLVEVVVVIVVEGNLAQGKMEAFTSVSCSITQHAAIL